MNTDLHSHADGAFATTRWSIVLRAGHRGSSSAGQEALAVLCATYWTPLYAYARRRGYPREQAQDLIQEFVSNLIEDPGFFANADRTRGRFRAYLLGALQHFLSNERARERTQKRGGHIRLLPLDLDSEERRFLAEPAHEATAEYLFERRFALAVLERVLQRLQAAYAEKPDLFACLKLTLTADRDTGYAELARKAGMTENAFKVAAHRLKKRYQALLRDELTALLAGPDGEEPTAEEVRQEMRALLEVLARR